MGSAFSKSWQLGFPFGETSMKSQGTNHHDICCVLTNTVESFQFQLPPERKRRTYGCGKVDPDGERFLKGTQNNLQPRVPRFLAFEGSSQIS
jgi:hypothetical protein